MRLCCRDNTGWFLPLLKLNNDTEITSEAAVIIAAADRQYQKSQLLGDAVSAVANRRT